MRSRRRWHVIVPTVLALALVAAACGGGEEETPAADGGAQQIAHRTIGYVDALADGAMQKRWFNYFEAAADKVGWTVQLADSQGDPGLGLTAAQNFVSQGVDALVISCWDTATVRPALDAAEAEGIPTIQVGCPVPEPLDAWSGIYHEDEEALSRNLAEYVIEDLGGDGEIALLYDTALLPGRIRHEVFTDTVEGSGVEVVGEQVIPLTDIVEASRRASSAFLTRNPDLDAIIAIYDFFAPPAISAIESAGRENVSVYSWYADQVNLPLMVEEDSLLKAVVDGPVEQVSFVAIDQLLRHFEKGEPIDRDAHEDLDFEYVIFTRENAPELIEDYITPWDTEEFLQPWLERWSEEFDVSL